jgi:hypothetical protein
MVDAEQKIAYFNTLVFTIVSGIVSLGILIFMFFKPAAKLFPFLITVEVGIFLIIIVTITQIILAERERNKYKNQKNFTINFTSCPDYYIERNIGDKKICSNEYIVEDKNKVNYIMKILPAEGSYSFPDTHNPSYSTDSAQDKFNNLVIANSSVLKDNAEKCAALFGRNDSFTAYSHIPWSGVQARCNSYVS